MATPANGRGRGWRKGQLKYTADEVDSKVKEYFQQCIDKSRRPTLEGLAGYMNVTSTALMIWMNAESEEDKAYNPEVVEILKKAGDYISDELQQHTDAMSIFRLKQPRYGGYTDKQQVDNSGSITVQFNIKGV